MVDHDIVGCNWLQLNPGTYHLLSPSEKAGLESEDHG